MGRMFFHKDGALEAWGDRILDATWAEFPGLARNQLALTWLVYDAHAPINTGGAITAEDFWKYSPRGFSYRGVEAIYPASVVKLFFLVAMQEWLERGMVPSSPELERAMADMIVDSSNDATGLIVDMLTGTTGGPELPPEPFETWKRQRQIVNQYFRAFQWPEFDAINVCQKTWGDGPYGRERAFYGEHFDNRNQLTTHAVARLLHAIVGGVAASPERSQAMLKLMRRSLDPKALAADPENQVTGFIGGGLPPTAQVWSKAGLMSRVRHDAAYVELPDRLPYLLVVFTEGERHSQNEAIIPFVAAQMATAMADL
jgi:hypothetical protein